MPSAALIEHNDQFPKSVIQLAPGIFGAVGFAASNVYMVEGLACPPSAPIGQLG